MILNIVFMGLFVIIWIYILYEYCKYDKERTEKLCNEAKEMLEKLEALKIKDEEICNYLKKSLIKTVIR